MTTSFFCKNFKKDDLICELCIINKTYIDVQNVSCNSCFAPVINK